MIVVARRTRITSRLAGMTGRAEGSFHRHEVAGVFDGARFFEAAEIVRLEIEGVTRQTALLTEKTEMGYVRETGKRMAAGVRSVSLPIDGLRAFVIDRNAVALGAESG